MARHIFQHVFVDIHGNVVTEGTITVYDAGTSDLATIYESETGSQVSSSELTSDSTKGTFEFWVDESDYVYNQRFKLILTKTSYTTQEYDDVGVFISPGNITSLGTVATGTWEATDIGVEHGGTGVSTLTSGGVLLGSGTDPVTAMAVLTDGQMIVGDGTTDPVAESGATLRTSIGVGTGDSPQLTGIELGHANDTTITRASAGVAQIQSTAIKMVGSAPTAHQASHSPNDGGDALDCAAGGNIDGVQAAAEGTADTLSRSDHAHRIQHSIANNAIMTIDDAGPANVGEYVRLTANGLEGRTDAEVKEDLDLEIGTDILAQQTIGIADDNLLEVDGSPNDNEMARFTAAGIEGLTYAETLTAIFSVAMPEDLSMTFDDALSADGKWCGMTLNGTAGATLAFGDLCYFAVADSRWELVDADAEATAFGLLGICILAAADDASATKMLTYGKIRADTAFPALTVGAPVFAGTTSGDVVTTAPSGDTDIVRIVGHGITANEMFFNPDSTFIEITV